MRSDSSEKRDHRKDEAADTRHTLRAAVAHLNVINGFHLTTLIGHVWVQLLPMLLFNSIQLPPPDRRLEP